MFALIFWLYRLPLGAVGYAALVCLFLLLVWFAVDYRRFAVRLRLLRRLEQEITLSTEQLPEPDGALEAQYQALVRALDADRRAQMTRSQRSYQDLVEYYTVWAHQIKTPIAAMRLLLQDADTDEQRALLEQLQSVEQYVEMVGGRAKVCIMIETAAAMARLDKILAVSGVDELFIGLNDLHISMGLTFMFELLSDGLMQYIADKCNKAGMPFGFGGIARIGEGDLPSDNILGEHVRLSSSSVILSRTFKGVEGVDKNARKIDLAEEVAKVRNRLLEIDMWDEEQHAENSRKIAEAVDVVVNKIQNKG